MKMRKVKEGLIGGSLNVLSDEDLKRIHAASIGLLQEHGMQSESDLILDIFKKGGANVDLNTGVIRLPSDLVENALKTVPPSFVLYGRDPEMDLHIEQGYMYFGMGGSSEPFYYDYDLNRPRDPDKLDVVNITRLGQAAENIDVILALCMAGDVPKAESYLHEYDAVFRNTTKPIIYSAPSRWYTRKLLEMASAVSGGEEAFRERPWVALYTSSISPMKIGDYNDGIVDAVEMGVPILSSAGAMMGSTCPVTLSGTLVQMNAEALFGIVFTQLIKPGAPVIYGPHGGPMDMTTGQTNYASAEQVLYRAGIAQLGRFYNIPTLGLGGGVESKLPDAEAASQSMMGMLFNVISGMTITMTLGTMGSGLYGSAEMVMICDEIVRMIKRIVSGIHVNDEKLSVDVIKEVGHGGEFLTHDHTMKFFREELFFPRLFRRQEIDQWIEGGSKSITEVAHERVQEILSQAGSVPLSEGAAQALEETLHKAIQEL